MAVRWPFAVDWHGVCSRRVMARVRPSLRSTETYTETNFLRLQTPQRGIAEGLVTLEHFAMDTASAWSCRTIIDAERMTRSDALFIARNYAREFAVPVVYESRGAADTDSG
jgi:hypothetical protein